MGKSTVRAAGVLLLVAGAVLMGLSTTGGERVAALEGLPPRPPLPAVAQPACDVGDAVVVDAGSALVVEHCDEDRTTETEELRRHEHTTTSCSTDEETRHHHHHHHRDDEAGEGAAATTSSTTTSTATRTAAAASAIATVSGATALPPTGAQGTGSSGVQAVSVVAPAGVTTVPVTGSTAPFGAGFILAVGGLAVLGVSAPRRRRMG